MKYLFIMMLYLICTVNLIAQDLVVSNENDSMKCKIIGIRDDIVQLTILKEEHLIDTLIPLREISYYRYKYFNDSRKSRKNQLVNLEDKKFSLALNGGAGYRIAHIRDGVSDIVKEYLNGLRLGYQYGGEMTFYFAHKFGAGLKINSYHASNSINNITLLFPQFGYQTGTLSEKISVLFVGPSFNILLQDKSNRGGLMASLALGYVDFTDKAKMNYSFELKGNTVGVFLDIGYESTLGPKSTMGFHVSAFSATLKHYEFITPSHSETIEFDEEYYESLARVDVSFFFRFIL